MLGPTGLWRWDAGTRELGGPGPLQAEIRDLF